MSGTKRTTGYRGGVTARRIAMRQAEHLNILSASALAKPVGKMRWLITGLWPLGSHGPLGGAKKTIKSYTALALAIAVASGLPAFGNPDWSVPEARPVLIFCGEGGQRLVRSRLQRIARDLYGIEDISDLPIVVLPDIAQFDTDAFAGYLFRAIDEALDGEKPGLVIVDSVYNYHPSGQDVQVSNVYDRGPMFARQSQLIRDECGQDAVLIMVDHFRKTGDDALDLDSISQAGMGEFADTWWLMRHRKKADPDCGKFWLRVEIGSRQEWPGTGLDLDWDIGVYDIEAGKWQGEITVEFERRNRGEGNGNGDEAGPDDIQAEISRVLGEEPFTWTKTKVRRKVMKELSIGQGKFDAEWDVLADEQQMLWAEIREIPEGARMVKREVWALAGKDKVGNGQAA